MVSHRNFRNQSSQSNGKLQRRQKFQSEGMRLGKALEESRRFGYVECHHQTPADMLGGLAERPVDGQEQVFQRPPHVLPVKRHPRKVTDLTASSKTSGCLVRASWTACLNPAWLPFPSGITDAHVKASRAEAYVWSLAKFSFVIFLEQFLSKWDPRTICSLRTMTIVICGTPSYSIFSY